MKYLLKQIIIKEERGYTKMNEIKRLTDEHYINLDPWEMCGQDNYCKRGCHEKGGCTNGCKIPYIYNSLAMREDYEIKHGLKLVYGYNLLLINNNEDIKNPLDIMGRTYKSDRYAFSAMSSSLGTWLFAVEPLCTNSTFNHRLGIAKILTLCRLTQAQSSPLCLGWVRCLRGCRIK